ncbi:MAG TPA: hypothetical protein VND64_22415 [Pirellulales bacterium]|nr:hypothetical protein [Pirellulales bacterium]
MQMPCIALVSSLVITGSSLFFGSASAKGADDESPLAIRAVEDWSGVFGGRELDFHFAVSSTAKAEVRGSWSMSAEGSVIARREAMLTVERDKPRMMVVRFELPAAREGIILPIDLTVSVQAGQEQARLEKRLWVFSDDPFALKKEWLDGLKITLFDPVGDTSRLFHQARIPFEEVRNAEQAAALSEGLFVVGEGVSWTRQRALPSLALGLASQGVAVLALAPGDGSLPLPGGDVEDAPAPQSVALRRADVIAELDKRLDGAAWPPDGKLQASGVQITAERGRVVARFVEGARGWPWFECRFAGPRARFLMCGFPVVKRWEAGPTPRYLLARMLERLAEDAQKDPVDEQAGRRTGAEPADTSGPDR